jgi:hypothetical protein
VCVCVCVQKCSVALLEEDSVNRDQGFRELQSLKTSNDHGTVVERHFISNISMVKPQTQRACREKSFVYLKFLCKNVADDEATVGKVEIKWLLW